MLAKLCGSHQNPNRDARKPLHGTAAAFNRSPPGLGLAFASADAPEEQSERNPPQQGGQPHKRLLYVAVQAGEHDDLAGPLPAGPSHRPVFEAGERLGSRIEEYDLRALGLADQLGRPTGEGRVLLEFLRTGGKLTRRGDDKDVLRLAKRLRDWMCLESEPLRFVQTTCALEHGV